jgi:hypothetical protein
MTSNAMPSKDSISSILINLKANDDVLLFILVANDGTLNRLGTGADNSRTDMTIRKTPTDLFAQLKPLITEEMLQLAGRRLRAPVIAGDICTLALGFRSATGETITEFIYGSESMGPPEDVARLVTTAVALTDPWYIETMS